MKVETTIKVTLADEELDAVKIVYDMLTHLSTSEAMDLNNELPTHIHLDNIKEGLAIIYNMSELDR